jgi:predicted lipoprotein
MIRVAAVSVFLLTATPAIALEDGDYAAAVAATAKGAIVPSYQAFGTAVADLKSNLDALCQAPGDVSLEAAQARFAETATAWARVQYISFGPVAEHQRAFRIEYWPDNRNVVGRQLAEVLSKRDSAALAPERFATTTVGVQGLPALERLLFAEDALAKLQPAEEGAAFRCRLLGAIGANLAAMADETVAGWTDGHTSFLARIEHPSQEDEAVPDGRTIAGRLLNDLLTTTIAMRDMKLLTPLGSSLEKAKPQTAEYRRSGLSIAALAANLEGWRAMFGADGGLAALLAAQPDGEPVADQVSAATDAAAHALAQITLPLDEAVADPAQRKQVEAFAAQLVVLRDLLAGPVTATLNLPIGFNALDGD